MSNLAQVVFGPAIATLLLSPGAPAAYPVPVSVDILAGPAFISGPRGEQGLQGIQGPRGEDGYATRAALASASPAAPIISLFVRGHTVEGRGGARYSRLGAAPSPAKPWHVQSADGAWWQLDEDTARPFHHGAVGDGVTDDTSALTTFFDFISNYSLHQQVNWTCNCKVSAGFTVGPASATIEGKTIRGAMKLTCTAQIDTLLTFSGWKYCSFDKLYLTGINSISYAARAAGPCHAIKTNGVANVFGDLTLVGFAGHGICATSTTTATTFDDFTVVGKVTARHIGSWIAPAATSYGLSTTYTSFTNNGASGSPAQSATLSGIVSHIPSAVTDFGTIGETPLYVSLNGYLHLITAIDRVANTVTLATWVHPSVPSSGTAYYIFGCGVLWHGIDSGVTKVSHIDAMYTGIAYADCAMYGGEASLVTQICGVAYSRGRSPGAAALAGLLHHAYLESNQWDIVAHGRVDPGTIQGVVSRTVGLSLSKVLTIGAPRVTSGEFSDIYCVLPLKIEYNGDWLQFEKYRNQADTVNASARLYFGMRGPVQAYLKDTLSVTIYDMAAGLHALTGIDTKQFIVHGTKAGGAPTQVTITPPTGWSINGGTAGAAAVFKGFAGPVTFEIIRYESASNFSVKTKGTALFQEIVTTAAYTLTSQTALQKLLYDATSAPNGAITLEANTTYEFECGFDLSAMSATSGDFSFGFGGTAVISSVKYRATAAKAAIGTPTSPQFTTGTSAAAQSLVTASTTQTGHAMIRGTLRITTAGTIIPQVGLGVAAAAVVGANAFFKIWHVGTNTAVGIGNVT